MFHNSVYNLRSNVARPIPVYRQSDDSVDQDPVFPHQEGSAGARRFGSGSLTIMNGCIYDWLYNLYRNHQIDGTSGNFYGFDWLFGQNRFGKNR
jgi:hypothetical protein